MPTSRDLQQSTLETAHTHPQHNRHTATNPISYLDELLTALSYKNNDDIVLAFAKRIVHEFGTLGLINAFQLSQAKANLKPDTWNYIQQYAAEH